MRLLTNKAGFTIIEILIALIVVCCLLLLAPPITQKELTLYEERLFLETFENEFKVVQVAAITTGKASLVTFLPDPVNTVTLTARGEKTVNKTLSLPKSLHLKTTFDLILHARSGSPATYREIIFHGKYYRYHYHFQLGGAKYYVEKEAIPSS